MSRTMVQRGGELVEVHFRDVSAIIGPIVDRNMRELFAEVMVEEAKENTPYDTGNNSRTIGILSGSDGSYAIGTASGYGGYLEFGTRRMPARPYFLPAAEVAKRNIENSSESQWQS